VPVMAEENHGNKELRITDNPVHNRTRYLSKEPGERHCLVGRFVWKMN
jgi:hypothetical protein